MNKIHVVIGLALLLGLASCGLSKTQENSVAVNSQSLTSAQQSAAVQAVDSEVQDIKESIDAMEKEIDAMGEKMDAEGEKMMEKVEGHMEDTTEKKDAMMKKEDGKMMDDYSSDDTMEKTDTMGKDEKVVMDKKMQEKGTYAAYSADMLGKTDNTVIFFHASWCPSCRAADSGISAGEVPAGLTILKADFDSETALKKKYGVVGQHTFVQVDADGNMLNKWLGGNDVASIEKKLK